MPIYILLSRLSQQGVATLKSNPDRLREVNKDVEELGAKVLHQWATLGEFDFVNVVEAPDTATIARVSVALGARGSTQGYCARRAERSRRPGTCEAVRLGRGAEGRRSRSRRGRAVRTARAERR